MTRYSNSRDRTAQGGAWGIGMVYTQCKPTEAEKTLKARQQKRMRAAVEKPPVEPEPAAWPPQFVPSIRVDRRGRIV